MAVQPPGLGSSLLIVNRIRLSNMRHRIRILPLVGLFSVRIRISLLSSVKYNNITNGAVMSRIRQEIVRIRIPLLIVDKFSGCYMKLMIRIPLLNVDEFLVLYKTYEENKIRLESASLLAWYSNSSIPDGYACRASCAFNVK
jgi:hypothetical protein